MKIIKVLLLSTTYLSEGRCTSTDVGEIELLLCLQNKWSQLLCGRTGKWESWNKIRYQPPMTASEPVQSSLNKWAGIKWKTSSPSSVNTAKMPLPHSQHHQVVNVWNCANMKQFIAKNNRMCWSLNFMLHTCQGTFVRIMLGNKNLLHTLYFADFLHNLRDRKPSHLSSSCDCLYFLSLWICTF